MAVLEYSLQRSVAPTEEPLTVEQAAKQCEVSANDHDEHFVELITAAREQFETDTGLALCAQTWVQRYDRPPERYFRQQHNHRLDDLLFHLPGGGIFRYADLHKRPVASLTSITYIDTGGDSQTMSSADYELDIHRVRPVVWLAHNASWPATRAIQNALTFTFVAGYGAATAVPRLIKQAMLLQLCAWFENRSMAAHEIASYDAIVHRYAHAGYP
jgi:hypothetical protein